MNRRTEDLYRGRVSLPGACYFVTIVTKGRLRSLDCDTVIEAVFREIEGLETDGDVLNICAVVMPDHLHWLLKLGRRLSLGQVISKLKGKLRHGCPGSGNFQRDFFDHRLRPDDDPDAYGLYMFLNPYRARLVTPNDCWAGWRAWRAEQLLFLDLCRSGLLPQP